MLLPFDEFAIAALVVVLVVGGMRLFYGSWPWEASKTWYRTRRAVAYVEALRGEKKRDPALVRDAIDTSSDSFDRSLTVNDTSPPEVTPSPEAPAVAEELAASVQKSSEKLPIVRRGWLKSNRRKPKQIAETAPATTGDSAQERDAARHSLTEIQSELDTKSEEINQRSQLGPIAQEVIPAKPSSTGPGPSFLPLDPIQREQFGKIKVAPQDAQELDHRAQDETAEPRSLRVVRNGSK